MMAVMLFLPFFCDNPVAPSVVGIGFIAIASGEMHADGNKRKKPAIISAYRLGYARGYKHGKDDEYWKRETDSWEISEKEIKEIMYEDDRDS